MRALVKFIVIIVLFAGFVRAAGMRLISLEKRKAFLGEGGRTIGRAPGFSEFFPPCEARSTPSFPIFGAGGFGTAGSMAATMCTGPIADRCSIEAMRRAFASRSQSGIADRLVALQSIPSEHPIRRCSRQDPGDTHLPHVRRERGPTSPGSCSGPLRSVRPPGPSTRLPSGLGRYWSVRERQQEQGPRLACFRER